MQSQKAILCTVRPTAFKKIHPAETMHVVLYVVLMLGQRLRRWPNIKTTWVCIYIHTKHETLIQCLVDVVPASQTVGHHWHLVELCRPSIHQTFKQRWWLGQRR